MDILCACSVDEYRPPCYFVSVSMLIPTSAWFAVKEMLLIHTVLLLLLFLFYLTFLWLTLIYPFFIFLFNSRHPLFPILFSFKLPDICFPFFGSYSFFVSFCLFFSSTLFFFPLFATKDDASDKTDGKIISLCFLSFLFSILHAIPVLCKHSSCDSGATAPPAVSPTFNLNTVLLIT